VSPTPQNHGAPTQPRKLGYTQSRLKCDQDENVVPSAGPSAAVRDCQQRVNLLSCQEADLLAYISLARDREHPLGYASGVWFREKNIPIKGVYGGKANVAASDAVSTLSFQIIQEC
jgi:hypothetical protein